MRVNHWPGCDCREARLEVLHEWPERSPVAVHLAMFCRLCGVKLPADRAPVRPS